MSTAVLIYPPPTPTTSAEAHTSFPRTLFFLASKSTILSKQFLLQFDGVHVVSGSLDTSIRVWDVESGACRHALMGHQVTLTIIVTKMLTLLFVVQSLTSGMELRDNILVSGNADSTVKIWDILTGQCLQTLSGKL